MKYRKKPAIVEAYQVTEELLSPILFDGHPYPPGLYLSGSSIYPPERIINSWRGHVITIHEQKTTVEIGDWIIKEPDGKHYYPCKPDIFEQTYEINGEQE